MRKALAAVAVLALAGASLGSAAPPAGKIRIEPRPAGPATGDTAPRGGTHLLLQAGAFDPLREELELSRVVSARSAEPGYGIVQLQPGKLAAKEALEKLGVKLYGYLPDNAFQVRLDARSRALLASLPEVRWVGEYQPGYKIHPRLWKDTGDVTPEMSVYGFPGESVPLLAAEIAKRVPGAVEISRLEDPAAPRLRYSVPVSQRPAFLDAVASASAVSWIEPYDVPQLHNNNALGPVQSNAASSIAANACSTCSIFGKNLTGTGQIVAVADSGCDSDMCFFRLDGTPASITDADSPVPPALGATWPAKKVFAYWVQPGATAYDNNAVCTTSSTSFHGTHTSGTVVGDNFASPSTPTAAGINTADGMAPNAKLLFQDVGHDTTGCLSGLNDSFSMFLQAKNGGARAHSNSYGSSTAGAYTGEEQNVDRFLFDNEEMTIFFSAGNDGSGAQTGGSPGNAKNIVTVGALGNGNSTTVAGFSSRGPTADGRIKPDIQAPGSSTVSAGGNGNHADGNCGTSSLSGTSMSCPTVAGASALLRQYFESGIYPTGTANAADAFSPGAALVKAVLLNGTRPLPDNSTFGNNNYGWGRVFLDNNLYFAGDPRRLRVWNVGNRDGLTTGQSATYTIDVPAGQELRVTLAWLDAEATLGSAVTLVNNLNLTVTGPGGTFLGNVFNGTGVSTTGGTADVKNTVEQVRFPAPTAGTYTITITGAAVPGNGRSYTNRQGFAVAASFASGCATAVVAAPTGLGASSNATMGADLTFTPAAASTLTQIYRAPGTCAAAAGAFQYIGSTATGAFTDGRAQGGLTYAYKVRGADICSEGPVSTCVSITPTGRCDLVPDFGGLTAAALPGTQCRVALSWSGTSAACPSGGAVRYNVYRSTTPGFTPAPGDRIVTTSATAYNDDLVSPGSTYYYIVRAEDTSAGGTGPNGGNEEQNTKQLYATPLGANGAVGTFTDDGGDTQAKLTGQTPWRIVTTQSQAGGRSYHPGPAAGPYPGSTCAALVTPALELTTGSSLSYWARYNLEYQWDGVVVEISTNGGASWTDLPPAGGYPSTLAQTQTPPINACGYPSSQGAFTGPTTNATLTAWTQYTSSLSPAYDNKTVQIRWRFTTDGGAEFDGFFLDTIAVTNAKGPGPCTPVGGCDNPTATVSGGGAICAGGSTNIQAALTGTPPWSVTWSDTVVQSNILVSPATRSVSPASSVTYTVTAVSSAICAGTPSGSAPVTVNPIPATPSITGAAGVCTNAALSLTATAGYTAYQWYLGANPIGGATSQTYGVASAQAANTGSYTVRGTLAGCTSLASAPLVVTVAPCAAPVVQSISKPCASTTGGLALTINGTGFQQGATVTLINTPAVVNSVTPTQIAITTASRVPTTPALGDVKVTNPDTQIGTLSDGFTYALRGDANGNGSVTGADAFYLNLHIFLGGSAPPTLCNGDANGNGATTGADTFYLNLYIFLGGAPPPA